MTSHLEQFCISNNDIECQWLEVMNLNQRNIVLCNLYRPLQGDVERFVAHLELCLENIDITTKDVFIMGDVNIDF